MGRLHALLYDRLTERGERAGLARLRRELLAGAAGTVVELGAGTGRNLPHYPGSVERLVLAEPDRAMVRRLRKRVAADAVAAEVLEAPAERLPLADGTADTVVATLVLCTVADVAASLGEVTRVLRPGGRFLFLEHVRAAEPRLARRQDRAAPVWRLLASGCHLNRDAAAAIEASALVLERLERAVLPGGSPLSLVDPLIVGSALAPGSGTPG